MARRAPNKVYEPIDITPELVSQVVHSEYVPLEVAASWTGLLDSGSLSSRLSREGVERVSVVRTDQLLAAFPEPRSKRKYERKSD